MQRVVHNKSIFSNGVLQLDLYLIRQFAESGINIDHVKFYEFTNGQYRLLDDDEVEVITQQSGFDPDTNRPTPAQYYVYLNPNENHLVIAIIYVDPTMDNNATADMPCCAQLDGNFWIFEEFFVDLTIYEKQLVSSINLKCNNCDVPLDNVNSLLKLFAIQAAVESHDPSLELIYSKIACGKRITQAPDRITKSCNCNG